MKSRYCKSSKLSEAKFRELVKYFAADLTATQIAHLSGLNINTVDRYLRLIRERIAAYCEAECGLSGVVDVDESLFGAKRVKGKRGRGAYGKTTVFGIYERDGRVYTEIVPNCSKATLQAIIRGRVEVESVINSDGWGAITAWSILATATSGSIVQRMNSQTAPIISTASKAFGDAPKFASQSSEACIPQPSFST